MAQQTCRTCDTPLTPRGHCPRCYRRRCARCGRPLLKTQSVAFTSTENYHLILPVCTAETEGVNGLTPLAEAAVPAYGHAPPARRRQPARAA